MNRINGAQIQQGNQNQQNNQRQQGSQNNQNQQNNQTGRAITPPPRVAFRRNTSPNSVGSHDENCVLSE